MAGRPLKGTKPRKSITLTVDADTVDRLETIAFWDKTTKPDLIDEAVLILFQKREAERGEPYLRR